MTLATKPAPPPERKPPRRAQQPRRRSRQPSPLRRVYRVEIVATDPTPGAAEAVLDWMAARVR